MAEWIRVEERLPNIGDEVWAYDGQVVFEIQYDEYVSGASYWGFDEKRCCYPEVTHWQPIIMPEPPQEQG